MKQSNTYVWLCQKDGAPYRVKGVGVNLVEAFNMLPKYRQIQATHGLVGFEINGVRQ